MSNIRQFPRSGSLRVHSQATGYTFFSPHARTAQPAPAVTVSRDELHAMIDDLIASTLAAATSHSLGATPSLRNASAKPKQAASTALGASPSLVAAIQAKARQNKTSRPVKPASKPATHALGASGGLVSAINRNKGT